MYENSVGAFSAGEFLIENPVEEFLSGEFLAENPVGEFLSDRGEFLSGEVLSGEILSGEFLAVKVFVRIPPRHFDHIPLDNSSAAILVNRAVIAKIPPSVKRRGTKNVRASRGRPRTKLENIYIQGVEKKTLWRS